MRGLSRSANAEHRRRCPWMRACGRRLDRIFRRSAQRRIRRTLAEALAATTVTEQVQQLIGLYRAQYFLYHRLSPTRQLERRARAQL